MTHSTPNSHTAARLENIRKLIEALQACPMSRDEIGDLLEMGPSGVRKYIADLGARVKQVIDGAEAMVSLAMDADQVAVYLDQLAAAVPARQVAARRTPAAIAARDPHRHFHILADDEHYAVRVSRAPLVRDWAVAALFGAGPAAMGAHA